jgi:tetratricopeptide (TPR) repeat protein
MGNIITYSGEDDELEQIESITKSAEWKKKGDDYLEEGIYQEAADCYTESLNVSTTYKCYTNRAYAYIKLGKFEEAISDSNLAIEMAPDAARVCNSV